MRTLTNNRTQHLYARRCAPLCITVWALIILFVAGCENSSEVGTKHPQVITGALPAEAPADLVRISASLTVEPYVIRPEGPDSIASGFEVDIVREALDSEGYGAEFVYEPLQRTKTSFMHHLVDGVMDVKDHYPEVQGACFSEEHITYHNFAVTLRSREMAIHAIADLKDKRVIAFQQANLALGDEFSAMAESNPEYQEMASQENQISMLFLGRTDAIVLDRHIFKYYRTRLELPEAEQAVTFHELFPPSHYRIAFRDNKVRDAFDVGLKKLQKSGRYQEIIDSYIER